MLPLVDLVIQLHQVENQLTLSLDALSDLDCSHRSLVMPSLIDPLLLQEEIKTKLTFLHWIFISSKLFSQWSSYAIFY